MAKPILSLTKFTSEKFLAEHKRSKQFKHFRCYIVKNPDFVYILGHLDVQYRLGAERVESYCACAFSFS